MIKRELSFFSIVCMKLGYNRSEFFLNKILLKTDVNNISNEVLSFLTPVKIKAKKDILKTRLKNTIFRVIEKVTINKN